MATEAMGRPAPMTRYSPDLKYYLPRGVFGRSFPKEERRMEPARKPIPSAVKMLVLLDMLGLTGKKIEWSHEPALGLRAINDAGTDYDPPQHDWRYIRARPREEHAKLTNRDNGTGRSDKAAIAHVKRLAKRNLETLARRDVASPNLFDQPEPVRKIKSRPIAGTKASGWKKPMRGRPHVRRRDV